MRRLDDARNRAHLDLAAVGRVPGEAILAVEADRAGLEQRTAAHRIVQGNGAVDRLLPPSPSTSAVIGPGRGVGDRRISMKS